MNSMDPFLCTQWQGRRKGGTLGASAPPMFGRTVNPISTRGADYAHHSTTSPLNFSDIATALHGATSQQESFDFCRLLLFLLLRATHLSSEKSDVEDTGGYSIPFTKVVDIRISKYVVHTPVQTFQLMFIRGSNQGFFWF